MTALGNLGVMLQLLAGEKLKGRFTVVRGGRRGIGTAIDHSGLANWAARGGEAYVAPLWVAAFCCMMDRVWAVNGGQQM